MQFVESFLNHKIDAVHAYHLVCMRKGIVMDNYSLTAGKMDFNRGIGQMKFSIR